MLAQAWPFAVTRGENSGYQAIVVPRFMADAQLTYLLEYASQGDAGEPDTVTVRDLAGATPGPLSMAYRVVKARPARYMLDGGDQLRDVSGRPIRVFEGLVLQLAARQVASAGLTLDDFDAVTELTVPAFRRLWTASDTIDPDPSTPISVGIPRPGTRPVNLRIADPYLVPGSATPAGSHDLIQAGHAVTPAWPPDPKDSPSRQIPRVTIIAVLAGLAALGYLLAQLLPSPPPEPVNAVVQQLCNNLKNGDISTVYQQFSNSYQQSVSPSAFQSSLLGASHRATCTSMTANGDQATLSLRRADGITETVNLTLQTESGQWHVTEMKVSLPRSS